MTKTMLWQERFFIVKGWRMRILVALVVLNSVASVAGLVNDGNPVFLLTLVLPVVFLLLTGTHVLTIENRDEFLVVWWRGQKIALPLEGLHAAIVTSPGDLVTIGAGTGILCLESGDQRLLVRTRRPDLVKSRLEPIRR